MTDPFASFIDPVTGEPVTAPQSQVAPGTPFYQSAGGNANQRGFVNAYGGGMGGGPGASATEAAVNAQIDTAAGAPIDWSQVDPTMLGDLEHGWTGFNLGGTDAQGNPVGNASYWDPSTNTTGSALPKMGDVQGTNTNPVTAIQQKLAGGGTLTPTERAFLSQQQGKTGMDDQLYKPDASGKMQYNPMAGWTLNIGPDGKPIPAGTDQGTFLSKGGKIVQDTSGGAAAQNALMAEQAKAAANPAAAPDLFGQFDSPTAASHVITPAWEKAQAAQAENALLASTQPGAIPAQPGASATVNTAAPSARTAPNTIPTTTATVPPATFDPFSAFLPALPGGPTNVAPGPPQIAPPPLVAPTLSPVGGY